MNKLSRKILALNQKVKYFRFISFRFKIILFLLLELYYFDISGKSLSIPNGLQNYYEDKDYLFLITTYVPLSGLFVNTTYRVTISLPSGQVPIVTAQ